MLWIVRSLPDETGSVRLGYVARGEAAVVARVPRAPVDEYEVLLDEPSWAPAEWIEQSDGSCFDDTARNGLACGHTATDAAVRHAAKP